MAESCLSPPLLWLPHAPLATLTHLVPEHVGDAIGRVVGQLLAIAGVQRAGYAPYALATAICTLPLAAASWWGLEKWALMARKWQPLNRQRVVVVS